MKKAITRFFFLLPLVPLCFSCSINTDFQKEGVNNLLFYNGDAVGASDLSSLCRKAEAEEIIRRVNDNETVFLVLTADNCSHCEKFKPRFQELLQTVPIEVFLCNEESMGDPKVYASLSPSLYEAFPNLPPIDVKYPFGYLIKSPVLIEPVSFAGQYPSAGALADFLRQTIYLENGYRYENQTGFEGFLKEKGTVGYVYKESIEPVREILSNASKPVALHRSASLEEGYYQYEAGLKKITKEDAESILLGSH